MDPRPFPNGSVRSLPNSSPPMHAHCEWRWPTPVASPATAVQWPCNGHGSAICDGRCVAVTTVQIGDLPRCQGRAGDVDQTTGVPPNVGTAPLVSILTVSRPGATTRLAVASPHLTTPGRCLLTRRTAADGPPNGRTIAPLQRSRPPVVGQLSPRRLSESGGLVITVAPDAAPTRTCAEASFTASEILRLPRQVRLTPLFPWLTLG